ncbi:MAG: hypothetical protein GPOALKHO_001757 [Sodalis sp.]|nr:MAG: hypothetical protein GPOALKHO_001757 [Sodalis sp.]
MSAARGMACISRPSCAIILHSAVRRSGTGYSFPRAGDRNSEQLAQRVFMSDRHLSEQLRLAVDEQRPHTRDGKAALWVGFTSGRQLH